MTAGGTVTFLNKLTDLVIFEVQQTPSLINDVQFFEVNGAGSGADSSPPAAETVSLPRSYNRHG